MNNDPAKTSLLEKCGISIHSISAMSAGPLGRVWCSFDHSSGANDVRCGCYGNDIAAWIIAQRHGCLDHVVVQWTCCAMYLYRYVIVMWSLNVSSKDMFLNLSSTHMGWSGDNDVCCGCYCHDIVAWCNDIAARIML